MPKWSLLHVVREPSARQSRSGCRAHTWSGARTSKRSPALQSGGWGDPDERSRASLARHGTGCSCPCPGLGFGAHPRLQIPEALAIYDGNPATQPLTDWTIAKGLGEVAEAVGFSFALSLRSSRTPKPSETLNQPSVLSAPPHYRIRPLRVCAAEAPFRVFRFACRSKNLRLSAESTK